MTPMPAKKRSVDVVNALYAQYAYRGCVMPVQVREGDQYRLGGAFIGPKGFTVEMTAFVSDTPDPDVKVY